MSDQPEKRSERELEIIKDLRRRYLEAGGTDAANHAYTEFELNFPEIFVRVTHARPEQRPYHEKMLKTLQDFVVEPRPAGLLLTGSTGAGKSALGSLLCHEAAQLCNLRPSYIDCGDMREDLRGLPSERERSHGDYRTAADPKQWPVLFVDDVGREAGNDHACDLVRWILDKRAHAFCFTIFATNLEWEDLISHLGGPREASRLMRFTHIEFTTETPDYRDQP